MVTFEESPAEHPLYPFELRRQCGLSQTEVAGRLGHATGLGDRAHDPEVSELEIHTGKVRPARYGCNAIES
ncbi:hypothetical protein GCM10010517_78030 [Streptosporangium fragile]|uniref:HTH cro/C1-type domain-containing protein n=1 Tax=Streptosporangium fragile TaxID=46186 RepID=A0ABN3WE38_9ACTN